MSGGHAQTIGLRQLLRNKFEKELLKVNPELGPGARWVMEIEVERHELENHLLRMEVNKLKQELDRAYVKLAELSGI